MWKIFTYLVKKLPEMVKTTIGVGGLEVATINDDPCISYPWVSFYTWKAVLSTGIDFTCCHCKKKILFLHVSKPQLFFQIWILIILTCYIWQASWNKLKRHSVLRKRSDLFVQYWNKLQNLSLQPQVSIPKNIFFSQ